MVRPEIKVIKMEPVSALASSETPSDSAKSLINGLNRGGGIGMDGWTLQ